MAAAWFVGRGGERSGPVSEDALREMAASGRLAPTDLVWRERMAAWAPTTSVPGLFEPSRPAAADATAVGVASRPYSFSAAFELATHTFKRCRGTLVYIGLITIIVPFALVIPLAVFVVASLALGVNPDDMGGRSLLVLVTLLLGMGVILLIGLPFLVGVTLTAANAALGRSKRGDLLLGFRRFGSGVAANLLLVTIAIGSSVVAGLLVGLSIVMFGVGCPLLGLPLWIAMLGSAYHLLFRSDRLAVPAR